MGKVPLALGGVLALIFAMRWLGKKMVPGARRGTSRAVQVLVQSPLSARQQLMLVQVGRRLVLVGNSGSEMSALCQIKDPDEVAEVLTQVRADKSSVAKSFGSLIGRAGKAYEAPEATAPAPEQAEESQAEEEPTTEAMQEELTGLMERARRISKQFQGTT
jgi:flagellar biogenesis protein FliO